MSSTSVKTNYPALYTLITVFFFWGFIAAGNSIFIPFCKHYFTLDQFQSQLIDFAFYTAYYVGALLLFALGDISGKDIEIKWDSTKPNGDLRRQMDITKQEKYGLLPNTSFKDALKKTYYYYRRSYRIYA